MLKKIVMSLVLTLLILFGLLFLDCCKIADFYSLKNIGYSDGEIAFIKENNISIKTIKNNKYIDKLESIVNNNDYKIENLDKYLSLYDTNRDVNIIIYMANNHINYDYSEKLVSLINSKYFIFKNLDRYMSYESNSIDDIIRMVNCNRDYDFYTNTNKADVSKKILMLVNKYYYLDNDYLDGNLVELDSDYSNNTGVKLNEEAALSFKELVNDALTLDLHIKANYGYRSYLYQDGVYNSYKDIGGVSYADSISARSGYSEHQTGLALDVGVDSKYESGKFQYSNEYTWMKDNSYKYGFILRYPEGKENITGYNFESWHYRYVGKEAAGIIHENDLTFEEYYAYYVAK